MGKEKIIGAVIFILALLVAIYYTWGLILIPYVPGFAAWVDAVFTDPLMNMIFHPSWEFLVILPVWLAAVLIAVIAMWIGWTMLTTPAPEPLEDFDFEEEAIAEKKEEEKIE